MSIFNAFWLATALWVLSLGTVGLLFGISSWIGVLTLIVVGLTPILFARRVGAESEPSLSQSIQRELR